MTLEFTGKLRIGERLDLRSEIASVTRKDGATGPMAFVSVMHTTQGHAGAIEERQDIVYLDIFSVFTPPKKMLLPGDLAFEEPILINGARLFRYSAATFNAHCIHYDLAYTQEVEKYPALIVHGPLQASMLIEAAERHSQKIARKFWFRGVHPVFHNAHFSLVGGRV